MKKIHNSTLEAIIVEGVLGEEMVGDALSALCEMYNFMHAGCIKSKAVWTTFTEADGSVMFRIIFPFLVRMRLTD